MIDYNLSKQLKDAGFPQIWKNNFYSEEGLIFNQPTTRPIKGNEIYIPTLSELIEEICKNGGERYFRLVRDDDGWRARNQQIEAQYVDFSYSPEEAVARLWLELNKKSLNNI